MDYALRWAFDTAVPFGGITCLFLGDFSQITPVKDSSLAKHLEVFQDFTILELTEGMRQQGDDKFLTALNNFSEGKSCMIIKRS